MLLKVSLRFMAFFSYLYQVSICLNQKYATGHDPHLQKKDMIIELSTIAPYSLAAS